MESSKVKVTCQSLSLKPGVEQYKEKCYVLNIALELRVSRSHSFQEMFYDAEGIPASLQGSFPL